MNPQDLLRAQYKQAHAMLEAVIDDCSAEALNYVVPGSNVGSIGAIRSKTLTASPEAECRKIIAALP